MMKPSSMVVVKTGRNDAFPIESIRLVAAPPKCRTRKISFCAAAAMNPHQKSGVIDIAGVNATGTEMQAIHERIFAPKRTDLPRTWFLSESGHDSEVITANAVMKIAIASTMAATA